VEDPGSVALAADPGFFVRASWRAIRPGLEDMVKGRQVLIR
jgi:hypothetical protein